jgi:bacterioferritin-associated ferredoxin
MKALELADTLRAIAERRVMLRIAGGGIPCSAHLLAEAAATISALVAERDDLATRAAVIDEALTNAIHMRREFERERDEAMEAFRNLEDRAQAQGVKDGNALATAQAGIAGLEKALRSIATNTCCGGCQEAARVARAALEHPHDA